MRLLIVTAVPAERDALLAGLSPDPSMSPDPSIEISAVGVGPAAAAAGTARLLTTPSRGYDAVLSAGIGGGFADQAGIGDTILATESVAAGLGADSPAGFLPLDELGFGPIRHPADPALLTWLRDALQPAAAGPVLTVTMVTGTQAGTDAILRRHPGAVAEGMEGFGVATAAAAVGVPFAELRTISNLVGPRDRAGWQIGTALTALTRAGTALSHALTAGSTPASGR